jgi:hypothetical protein
MDASVNARSGLDALRIALVDFADAFLVLRTAVLPQRTAPDASATPTRAAHAPAS